jgi:hypothetical protein
MAHWNTDTMLCALFGDEWCEGMELHNDATMEQNVATANEWLQEQGYAGKQVLECKESGDELEWLCNFEVVV